MRSEPWSRNLIQEGCSEEIQIKLSFPRGVSPRRRGVGTRRLPRVKVREISSPVRSMGEVARSAGGGPLRLAALGTSPMLRTGEETTMAARGGNDVDMRQRFAGMTTR